MEVLGSGYMSPCSDFSQSFQSVRQTASDNCSPYSNLNCIQQSSPANPFNSPQLATESQRISPLSNTFASINGETCTEGGTAFSTVKQEGHTCDVCSKVFSERSLLQKHKVAHADAKHICATCGRAFVREDKLRRHIRSIHSDERPFVCEVCSKAFARKDKLQEHARHHNRDITFPCPACNEVFLMRSLLNRHLRLTHQMKSADSQNASAKAGQSTNSDNTTPSSSSRKRSKRQANNNNSTAAVVDAANNARKAPVAEKSADLTYAAQQQDHVGWNAANLLLYNRYQQQQQQAQQAQQMEMPWGTASNGNNAATSGYLYNPSQAAAAAAYQFPSQYAAAAMMRHARPAESQQQQQAQQQQPRQVAESTGATQQQQYSAFSAAMAARLFSPSNYANWWQQAGPNFMFPQTQLSRAANTTPAAAATNGVCYQGEAQPTIAAAAATTAATTPAAAFPSSSSSSSASSASYSAAAAAAGSQALAFQAPNFSSLPTTTTNSAVPAASLVELSSVSSNYNVPAVDVRPGMLASLPSFAQAVYYRAASLAASQGASQNGQQQQQQVQQQQQQHLASAFAPPAAYSP